MLPSLEERVAYLEGKVEEHSRGFDEIRTSLGRVDGHVLVVDGKVDRFREELSSRIEGLREELSSRIDGLREELSFRIDGLREELSSRIEGLGVRIEAVDLKVDRFRDELDRKMSRQFTWIVGIQVTVLVVVLGSLIQG